MGELDLSRHPGLRRIAQSAQKYAEASLAPASKRAYASDWRTYENWCKKQKLASFGPPPQIAMYLAHLADSGKRTSTIERALTSICKAYDLADLDNPRFDKSVRFVRRGIRRMLGVAPDRVDALLPAQLLQMSEALPHGEAWELRSARNRALLLLGFAGAFRRSEVVALDMSDVQQVDEGLRVTLRRSKDDQEGKGRMLGIPYGGTLGTCPVRAVKAWIEIAQIDSGPIFRSISRNGKAVRDRALTDRQVANIVKRAAKLAGLSGRHAGHSLRSGLVTSAVIAGKSLPGIKAHTGHTTLDMLMRYVREQGVFDDNPAAGIGL